MPQLKLSQSAVNPVCLCIFAIAVLLSPGVTIRAEALSDEQRSSIDAVVDDIQRSGHYPGISIAIDRGGVQVYTQAFGLADLENDTPARVETAYPIGSITKSFTALAVLQLVAAGDICLEDTVADYLADYKGPAKSVKIWQLLNHTSGIPNYTSIPGVRDQLKRQKLSRREMVAFFEGLPLQFKSGTRFNYTNSGYYLLGLIIEKVTGRDYYAYLRDRVFVPYSLNHTSSGDDEKLVGLRARGYNYADGDFTNASPWHFLVPYSAGSLISTVVDLVRYRKAVFDSALTSERVRELVIQKIAMRNGEDNPYTLGALIASQFHGRRKYSHAGEIFGFYSNHAYYPDHELTIAILTNHKGAVPSPVSMERKIARIIFEEPPLSLDELKLTEAKLAEYGGDFYLAPIQFGPSTYGFVTEQGRLALHFGGMDAGGPPLPLLAVGTDQFVSIVDDEWIFTFDRDIDGEVSGFSAVASDATFYAQRLENDK